MSFYRSILAAVAAVALVAPVFADDTTSTTTTDSATDSTVTQTTSSNEDGASTTTTTTTSSEETKVDINKATRKELTKVKGITPSKAKAIIEYRKKNGDFKSLDDLTNVSGFKTLNEKTLKSIQDHLSVE